MSFYLNWWLPFQIIWVMFGGFLSGVLATTVYDDWDDTAEKKLIRARILIIYIIGIFLPVPVILGWIAFGLYVVTRWAWNAAKDAIHEALNPTPERHYDFHTGKYVYDNVQDYRKPSAKNIVRLFVGLDKTPSRD